MQIWDTAGQEQYKVVPALYYRGASAGIVCYDVSAPTSFEGVRAWVNSIRAVVDDEKSLPIVLVGTKADLPSKVSSAQAMGLVRELKLADAFECSSKSGSQVEEVFTAVARLVAGSGRSRGNSTVRFRGTITTRKRAPSNRKPRSNSGSKGGWNPYSDLTSAPIGDLHAQGSQVIKLGQQQQQPEKKRRCCSK